MPITIIYPLTGDQVTLTLPGSNWEEPSGYLAADQIIRSDDGTLLSYRSYLKRFKNLKWAYLTSVQKAELELVYAYGGPFIFADSADPDNQFTALMMSAPQLYQVWKDAWAGEVEVQEI